MRILAFAFNYTPERTGGAVTSAGRMRYLAEAGHEVTVVTGFPYYPEWRTYEPYRGRFAMRELVDGLPVLRRWHVVPRKQGVLGRSLMEATFALTSIPTGLVQPRPDLVLSATPAVSALAAGAVAARRFGVPHGVFVLDLAGRSAEQSGMPGGRIARRIADPIEGALLRSATRIGIITEGFRAPLEALGVRSDRLERLTDWKLTSEPTLPREEVRQRIGLPCDAPVVLHTGNIGYKQGLEHLAPVAAIAAREMPELRFVLIGDGNQRALVEGRCRALGLENVVFLPLQPAEIFPSLLGSADVLLLHQRAQVKEMSLPSKLADYLAAGRPVVAAVNETSEAAHEVRRACGGVVVRPEDPRALFEAVAGLLQDPARACALGRAGQAYTRQRYTRAALAAAFDDFVDRTMAESRQRAQA